MPFGFSGGYGSYREPAPRRLTLEELLAEEFTPRQRPTPITSLRDLEGDDRRTAQMDSLWGGLASMGALLSGDRRGAAAGLGDIQGSQDRALGAANARQEAEYEAETAQQAHDLARQKREQEAKALLGMYEEVSAGESPEFTRKAEQAARSGSMAELEKLRESKPQRAAAKAKGYDPDAWDTTKRLQDELAAELERAQKAAAWEGEKGRLTEKEKLERESAVQQEKDMRALGPRPQAYEPPSHAAAVEEARLRVRQKYEKATVGGQSVSRIGQLADGSWAEIHRADETHPKPYAVPIDGLPATRGDLLYYTKDGVRMVHDKNHPELGAYPMQEHEEGSLPTSVKPGPPIPPGVETGRARSADARQPAAAPPAAQKSQAEAAQKLSAVKDPGMLKKIQAARANGYSDSEIAAFLGLR